MKAERGTKQVREWASDFGREYTDRNTLEPAEVDALWLSNYGVTRTELNRNFLEAVPSDASILEVGCNVGNQLLLLSSMGYTNLCGIDVQSYAIQIAQTRVPSSSTMEGSALDIPFPDRHFDLVCTCGLLIHIAPADLPRVLSEIRRVTKRWILGFEYYSPALAEVNYRGHEDLLWKNDFARLYQDEYPDLKLVKEQRVPYLKGSNTDTMFLLQRIP
jgi:pseudaminic acid biosynthesis-associated methylase